MSSALSLSEERGPGRMRRWVAARFAALGWRGGLLLVALGALVAAGLGGVSWPVVGALALAVVALAVVCIVRGDGAELLGPICWYDLVRLARRRRTIVLRCAYPLVLLLVLYHVYGKYFPDYIILAEPFGVTAPAPHEIQAEVGRAFVTAILVLQGMTVLLLTPAYLAGAVAQEREQRTLELLFTTHLRDHEIVLGKLFSRFGHLAVVLLSSLPVLLLVEMFGGVEVVVVLGGFASAALCLVSVGCLSMLCSVLFRRVFTALLATYTLCGVLYIGGVCWYGLSPLTFVLELEERIERFAESPARTGPVTTPVEVLALLLVPCLLVHGLLSLTALGLAVVRVRYLRHHEPRVRPRRTRPPRVTDGPGPKTQGRRPPIGDRPLFWKEIHFGPGGSAWFRATLGVVRLVGLIVIALLAIEAVASRLMDKVTVYEALRIIASSRVGFLDVLPRLLVVLFAAAWCLAAAYQASCCIGAERDRGTLDGLLTMPVERRTILSAKWWGCILRARFLGYFLLAVLILGTLMGLFAPLAALFVALACLAHITFLTSFGVWLSVVCQKTLTANLVVGLLLTVVFPAAWFLMPSEDYRHWGNYRDPKISTAFFEVGLNPLRTWWALGYSPRESVRDDIGIDAVWTATPVATGPQAWRSYVWADEKSKLVDRVTALAGSVLFLLSGAVFWRLARRRFAPEPRRRDSARRARIPSADGLKRL